MNKIELNFNVSTCQSGESPFLKQNNFLNKGFVRLFNIKYKCIYMQYQINVLLFDTYIKLIMGCPTCEKCRVSV